MKNRRGKYSSRARGGSEGRGWIILAKLSLSVFGLAFAGGLFFLGYGAFGQSDFFQIIDIGIEGCQRISKKEILELSGVDVHSNLVKISKRQVKELLERHEWIKQADISKSWPDRLTIVVKERIPVAIVNLDDGLYYVDKSADLFAPVEASKDLDYPVITGLGRDALHGLIEPDLFDEALLFIKYASRDNPYLPAQNISEISVSNNELILFLLDRPFPISLGRGDIRKKYNRLVKVLYWLYKRKEIARVSYVDVGYAKDKVLVGMVAG